MASDVLAAVITLVATGWHLGPVHGFERFLVAVVAFGPFVVLAVVAVVVRRRDTREHEDSGSEQ